VAHLYWTEQPGPFEPGEIVELVGSEAHHAARVGRLTVGETTRVGDGAGFMASAVVEVVGGSKVSLRILDANSHPLVEPQIWLAQALAKGDRDELAIQTATELGVFGVIPFVAKRSVSQWRLDKVASGIARWKKIVEQASKQSLRAWVPEVRSPLSDSEILETFQDAQILVLQPGASQSLSEIPLDGTKSLVVVVGPEGGLEPQEIARFEHAGARLVRLGSTVLRTSSAGPAALAVLNHRLGRF
jgi:16S rRNA (uracil1498-N3)-methyltransferase